LGGLTGNIEGGSDIIAFALLGFGMGFVTGFLIMAAEKLPSKSEEPMMLRRQRTIEEIIEPVEKE
jgi:hypothetical protein